MVAGGTRFSSSDLEATSLLATMRIAHISRLVVFAQSVEQIKPTAEFDHPFLLVAPLAKALGIIG